MKTLTNIKTEHLKKLKGLIDQAIQNYKEPTSLLAWVRLIGEHYSDSILDMDLQAEAFMNRTKMQVITLELTDSEHNTQIPSISGTEPDMIHFQILFKHGDYCPDTFLDPNNKDDLKEIFTLLMVIIQSDCTGCCNALSLLNITYAGIYAMGYIGQTYHS